MSQPAATPSPGRGALAGRTALITGASSGIGRGVAQAFAAEGALVAVNYPDASQRHAAETACAEICAAGGAAVPIEANVADEAAVTRMIAAVQDAYGHLDILVNNAGVAHTAPIEATTPADWDRIFAVHVRGAFLATRLALPGMYARNYGRIITTASQLAYKGAAGLTAYTAAKGALLSMTRSLALEIGVRNVTANCVAPGATHTPILEAVPADVLEEIRRSIPRGRLAEVDDIVPTYVFLASEAAGHFQGQCLSPNGGDVFL